MCVVPESRIRPVHINIPTGTANDLTGPSAPTQPTDWPAHKHPLSPPARARYRMIGISLIALFCFFFRPRANLRRTKTEGKKATPCSADSPSFRSPPASVLPSNPAQHEPEGYYDLAVRVKHLSPPDCIWLQSDAVQITDTTAFSSGGFSEVWRGSFQDLPVAVKSLRCYSSPDFDPADVGIVSFLSIRAW